MFENLEQIPLDPIFRILGEYKSDSRKKKVNLTIGFYFDQNGKPYVFPVAKKAFKKIDQKDFYYQPIGGNQEYLNLTANFVLDKKKFPNLAMISTCGGTQACRLFADLIKRAYGKRKIYIATPTWGNHFAVFQSLKIQKFEHLDEEGEINFQAYKDIAKKAEAGSIILLQGGQTHNPTGLNLSLPQLEKLIKIINKRKLTLYIDAAYIGMGEGLAKDKKYLKLAYQKCEKIGIGVSYSKNASLYELRTGALFIKTENKTAVESQLQQLTRESISMAPGFGQEIMIQILKNHRKQWETELEAARKNLETRKKELVKNLPPEHKHLKKCQGLFGLLHISKQQLEKLRSDHGIYITDGNRINFGGLRQKDIPYIAKSLNNL